jgi:hypothetical protein
MLLSIEEALKKNLNQRSGISRRISRITTRKGFHISKKLREKSGLEDVTTCRPIQVLIAQNSQLKKQVFSTSTISAEKKAQLSAITQKACRILSKDRKLPQMIFISSAKALVQENQVLTVIK